MGKFLQEHIVSTARFIDEIGRASRRIHPRYFEDAMQQAVVVEATHKLDQPDIFPYFLGYGESNHFRNKLPDVSRKATHVGDFRVALVHDKAQQPTTKSTLLATIGFEFQRIESPAVVEQPSTICVVEGWKSLSFSNQPNDLEALATYQEILGWPWRAYLLSILEAVTHNMWEMEGGTRGLAVRKISYEYAYEADRFRRKDPFPRRNQLSRAEQVTRHRPYISVQSDEAIYPSLLLYSA